jgi:hypothetical protein
MSYLSRFVERFGNTPSGRAGKTGETSTARSQGSPKGSTGETGETAAKPGSAGFAGGSQEESADFRAASQSVDPRAAQTPQRWHGPHESLQKAPYMAALPALAPPMILIVDDLCTRGRTMRNSIEAIRARGVVAIGFATSGCSWTV